jgi:hypothetical protein
MKLLYQRARPSAQRRPILRTEFRGWNFTTALSMSSQDSWPRSGDLIISLRIAYPLPGISLDLPQIRGSPSMTLPPTAAVRYLG